jgi:glycosyltransferase involved in cell wall biosynthesis
MDRYTVGLARELVRQNVEVTFFHREREPLNLKHLADLECRIVGLKDLSVIWWEQLSVPLELRRGRYDLFHAPADRGVPFISPCPVVLTFHSATTHSYHNLISRGLLKGQLRDYLGYEWSPGDRGFYSYYFQTQRSRADHILTPSNFCREEIVKFLGIAPEKVTVTHLAVSEEFEQPVNDEEQRTETLRRLGVKRPYLLYVGGYEPHKNVEGLLEVFALVRKRLPHLSLVVVGTNSLPDRICELADRLGLKRGEEVVFLVNVTDDLRDLYDGAELFVSLSWRESFCLPLLEALSRGIPVVASEWGAAKEVAAEVGRFVDPRDSVAASQEIYDLCASNAKAALKEKALAQARKFSWKTTAATTIKAYHSLIGTAC